MDKRRGNGSNRRGQAGTARHQRGNHADTRIDGRTDGRNATATIPINRRDCEAQPGTMIWHHDSQVGGQSCDASRTECLVVCGSEAVLESW
ncbi:hypothetical protein [Maricaulis sp.]|uniref:hypothetical protein n=1 Tax=Maricaulis sp. TaxID=1486257 RepID=UPI002B275A8E|nr:hypothetical protein [Maricaulis sp.]